MKGHFPANEVFHSISFAFGHSIALIILPGQFLLNLTNAFLHHSPFVNNMTQQVNLAIYQCMEKSNTKKVSAIKKECSHNAKA